jgi:hypothetical protein
LGGRARSRHQLSTLLSEAFENREALEERIAEGRRNRKEAGNKYGEQALIYILRSWLLISCCRILAACFTCFQEYRNIIL